MKWAKNFLYKYFNLRLDKLPPKKSLLVINGNKYEDLKNLINIKYKFYFVCLGEKDDSIYWLRDWLNVFSGFNFRYIAVLRSKELQDWVFENYPTVDSVTINGFQSVVDFYKMTSSIELALYPINSMHNHMFVRLTPVRHVFIGHGDSDKLSSANKVLRMFDEIWCSGQAQVDRMLNQDFDCSSLRLRRVGRPGLLRIISDYKTTNINKNKLLYMPTWEGSDERWNYSSVSVINDILNRVVKQTNLKVNVRLHPFTGKRIKDLNRKVQSSKKYYAISDRVVFSNTEKPLVDILNDYDYFVCDVSSVVTECLAWDRPIFLFKADATSVESAESNIRLESFCYTFLSADELVNKLINVLNGNDYKAVKRAEAAEYFIGLEETKNNIFKKLLSE